MQITDLKILGYKYTVIEHDDRDTANSNQGSHWASQGRIYINKNQTEEQKVSTLLHEILEAIDYHLELKLKHEQINRLETIFYQVLKDNKKIYDAIYEP